MKWISVKRRMPPEGDGVIVTDGTKVGVGCRLYRIWWGDLNRPTHWMPLDVLPKPPRRVKR